MKPKENPNKAAEDLTEIDTDDLFNMDFPEIDFKLPEFPDIKFPKIDVKFPEIDIKFPEIPDFNIKL